MEIEVTYRAPTAADMEELADKMRLSDKREAAASDNLNPFDAVFSSVAASDWAEAAFFDGKIVCIYGVATNPDNPHLASPWLLGTDEISEHPRTFLRESKEIFKKFVSSGKVLEQFVYENNKESLHWLRWLGFNIYTPVAYGYHGFLFNRVSYTPVIVST